MTHRNIFSCCRCFPFECFSRYSSCSSAVWLSLWKRQCFMAIEGRSHMCISCCTNIVQCRAWNKKKGWRQAGSSFHEPTDCRQLLHQHRTDQFIPQTQACVPLRRKKKKKEEKKCLPFVQDCKRDLSQNPVEDWEKGIQTFLWRFSSPSSSSSLRWLLATYEPSEHPKPPATQHF